ncbi:MAG: Ig-like domain-containing protein [Halopseudomonas sp.]|uniref:Ig-like domain-containing protein n=1 Tax=Halopseudomonas sp. TaxID=2901191 RepID=UPI003001C50B
MWWSSKSKTSTSEQPAAEAPAASTPVARPPLMQALEPRMMFDGAVAATVVDAAADHNTDSQPESSDVAAPGAAGEQRQEIVFVDSNVQNYQQLVDGVGDGVEVVLLDGSQDGLQQIADYLDGRSGIDSIHILSHGDSGRVQLGSTWLDSPGIATHQALLSEIGATLSDGGDILLYGCKVGAEDGFLEQLATATGADVAGSRDNTGSAVLNGNWTLEASTGAIEASQLDAAQTFASYNALLAAPSSENFDGVTLSGGYSFGVQGQARTLNGWTFSVQTNSGAVDSNSYVDITNQTGDTSLANDGSDAAALLNGGFNAGTAAVLKSTSGDAFSFQSIRVENGFSPGNDYRLVGYLDGAVVSGASIDFNAGNYGSGGTLVSASGSAWQQVDEVRIVRQSGVADVSIYVDDITVASAVSNVAPSVGNLNGDSVTFTQGNGAILLDASSNATLTDADSANFNGGNITVSIVTNAVAGEDLLGIENQGTGAGQIGLSGSNVTYTGVTIGSFTGGSGGADLVVSLNGNATAAAAQALVQSLTYSNSNAGNAIDQADRTVRVTVNDGDGGTSSNADVTVAVVETVAPTTTSIVVADTALRAGETTTVTITFNEAVSGLGIGDFSVANGALSNLTSSDGGITWTATLTPTADVEDTSNLLSLDNTGVQDAAGNTGTGTTDSNNYAIDTLRPTASIVVADTALAASETSTVTITFNEAVSGLTTADFSVANGILSNLSSSDGGITWTATLTPTADVQDTSNLVTLSNTGYSDGAGNTGTGTTDSNNYAIDTLRPTASIVVADTALAASETSTVTITFNEAVSGLGIGDFSVANGALSNLTSSDGGITWTATLTPSADVEDTSNLVSLDNTGYIDAAGNTGTGTTDSNNYAIDTLRPTGSIVVADTALAASETSTVTITFNEAVGGLGIGDFSVANGALSNLTSSDGGITWTATLTPTAAVEDTSNLVSLDNTGYIDTAGNSGTGTTDSNNYAIDTLRPTASIVVADTALATGETSSVTVTFSEAVIGLTEADFSVANGVLSNLSSSDGGITWTATLTPNAGVQDASNLVTLSNTGYADAAGNTGTGTTDSSNYAIDTLRPTASIVVADTALAAGETSTVTITFNEAVTGLDVADFSVANGVLSDISSSDGGITWTATLTPSGSVEDTSNLITLTNSGVADAAGNVGAGTTDSNNYSVDTVVPVNTVPGAQTTDTITPLVFSNGNGNAISVSDSGNLTVVVSVASGTLRAITGGAAGISDNGTGTITLTGTAAEVNAALEGLTYTPGGADAQSISIQSTDAAGNVDSDTVAVTVSNSSLLVTSNQDSGDDQTTATSFAADQADGGGLSVREALFWARSGDSISFDLNSGVAGYQGGTITLNGNQLTINTANLSIDGDLNDDGVADVTISGNNASRVMLVNSGLTGIELTGLTLTEGNTNGGGGALYLGFGTNVMVRDSSITNSIDGGVGGGGVFGSGASLTLINSTVSGNTSSTFGGGIRNVGSGATLNLINSTVNGNSTTGAGAHGGGIQVSGDLTIINSTISGNTAAGASSFGGGLRITSGTAFIYNSTIVGNASAGAGGGISAQGTDTFVNVVVAGNTSGAGATAGAGGSPLATGGSADDVAGTVESATNSYFGSNVFIANNTASLNNQGTANLLLGDLAYNNGGDIQTHALLAGSALLEAGSNASLPADTYDLDGDSDTTEPLPIDASGDDRVSNIVDIGAVEGNSAPALSNVNGGATFVENGTPVIIDADASVSDRELDLLNSGNGDYNGATLTIIRNGGAVASDLFGFVDGNGISLSGGNLVKNGQIIANLDSSVAGQLLVTFTNANGEIPTRADVNAVLQQLTYSSSSNDPGNGLDLNITLGDGAGASDSALAAITVTPINDAPTLTATGSNPSYTENDAAVLLFSGASISTVEAGQSISSLSMTISNLANGASELLSIDGSEISLIDGNTGTTAGNGLTYSVSLSGSTATITVSSAAGVSAATAETIINGIGYRNASDAPSGSNRAVTLTAISDNGGAANGGTDGGLLAVASTVTLSASNDAPVITAPINIDVFEDTAGALTGISFSDTDAGSASVTATFSVASGSLSAVSGSGVTVGGSASSLTLSGSIADINAFISAGQLSFTTAANANADVTLSISIDDGGNTGGPAQSDNASLTLNVTAVNDAPVNTVPGAQSVDQSGSLVFSAANGNQISISDVDAGSGTLRATLTASNGLITLSGTSGLSFVIGSGANDGTMTFEGSLVDINNALNGLTFSPTPGYNGAGSIQITSNDLGFSGSGSVQTDTDVIAISVEPLNPIIISTGSSSLDGTYKVGDTLTLTVTFDQAVIVDTGGGNPELLLETGSTDRAATYVSGSGSSTLTFNYTVQAGDLTADLNYQSSSALSLNGATIRSAASDDAVLTLPATGSADSIASQHALAIDGVRPTASVLVADTALAAGETSTVTITFSEAVVGVDLADFAVENGTLSNLATNDNVTYTATLTPNTDTQDTSNLITLDNSGYLDTAGNTGAAPVSSNNFAIDTLRPSATIVVADTALVAGDTSTVTITFNEAVSGLDLADLSASNGALSDLASSDGGITWTAILTPSDSVEDTSNLVILDNTGYLDAAGNTGTGTTESNNYAIDTQRPTASIVVADTALAAGETSTVTITFNEAVSGLTAADFTVENGALSNLASIDGGITWTATLTPTANVEDTSNLVTLDNTGVQDAVGNAGSGTTDSNSYAVDTQRPTASIVVADTALAAGQTSNVTITFNEAVSGLTAADFTVENGALSNLASIDGGITWTATLTPAANVEDTSNLVTLDNTGVQDAAGNTGVGTTDSNNYAIDTQRPTASIVVADTALAAGETSTVTITFNEAVSGLTPADFTVENGALSNLASIDGGITWTATLTPAANVEDTSNLVTLDNTGVQDAAGNTGVGTTDSNNYAIDTLRPSATIVVADTALAVGETSTVTITFSEAVSGLDTADFSVANGALGNLTSSDGGLTWTATLTPTANVEDTSNLVTLDNTGYLDAAGNTGTGTTDSNNFAIDTLRPTATIVVADTALAAGETSTVTITFNEAVSGLDVADFSVANGVISGLTSGDGGITWTATLTPTADVEDTSNLVTLDNTGVQDAAGNAGIGMTESNNYAIDTLHPTATIAVADTALAAGETSTVTITFNEAVSGLDVADFSVANGALSNLASSDGGVTWTATLTPIANMVDTSNLVTLDNTGVQDAAGNTGVGTTDSNNYTIDTLRPAATIVVADTTLAAGETSTVTITFNEAVSGLDVADFSVANGALSNLTSSDGGISWTATLTPTADVEDTSNLVTLDNTGVQDVAGNAGVGTTDSNNYAIDTLRPTASIVIDDTAMAAGETSSVTITFNEAVSGLDVTDFSLTNGVLSGLGSSDGGITWTATLTPTADVEDTSNLVTLDNTGVADAAGNAGVGATDSNNYAVDTLRPTASIVIADTALAAGETSSVTITFNEAVSGLDAADFSVENGAISGLSSSDGGITWTATLTPTADVEDTSNLVTLNNAGVQDAAGNAGVGTTDSNSYAIDTLRPTASIMIADTALAVGETSTVTITFNEAVGGLDAADFAVANGTLSALTSNDGGITWTATLTPTADVEDTSNLITLNNTGVQDAAGNAGTGITDSNNYTIDTLRPTASIMVADTAMAAGETSTVTITFSEAVSGLDVADFSVTNGALSNLTSSDGGITWTATLTPSANVEDTSNLVTLDNTGIQDVAGNTGTGTTDSNNYAIDTLRPTATIVLADTALAAGETSIVTITFSEAVSGLDATDFSVANGTLGSLASSDGGITWTATLTPTADVEDVSNLVTLNNTGYLDAAGNTGAGTTDSNSYAIDTLLPAVTSVSVPADATYVAGDQLDFTVNFSEAVSVEGGTPRLLVALDNGATAYADYISGSGSSALVFRLTVTEGQLDSNGIELGEAIILNGATLRDAAGNAAEPALNNVAATEGVQIDAVPPQVSGIELDAQSPTNANAVSFTVSFSEDVSGVDLGDFQLDTDGNATGNLASLVQLDAQTYQVNVTGVTGLGSLGLTLNAAGSNIVDAHGTAMLTSFSTPGYQVVAMDHIPDSASDQNSAPPFMTQWPTAPAVPDSPFNALLTPQPLFAPSTLGSDLSFAPSWFQGLTSLQSSQLAQIFQQHGFFGFGGDTGAFDSSDLAQLFDGEDKDTPPPAAMNDTPFGAPGLQQQLQQLVTAEQQRIEQLGSALSGMTGTTQQS